MDPPRYQPSMVILAGHVHQSPFIPDTDSGFPIALGDTWVFNGRGLQDGRAPVTINRGARHDGTAQRFFWL